jgi:superfamily II DNA or RNA helicase
MRNVLQGGMGAKAHRAVRAQLAAIPANEERLVLATGRYIGEGFDDARLDTLFLAMPVAWKGTLVQHTGRLHRLHPGKSEVRIFDYVDRAVPMLLRMFEKRLRGYRAIGYARGGAPLGCAEPRSRENPETASVQRRAVDDAVERGRKHRHHERLRQADRVATPSNARKRIVRAVTAHQDGGGKEPSDYSRGYATIGDIMKQLAQAIPTPFDSGTKS